MLTLNARAKINLTLDILGKRPDNYHEVKMVMQQIELSDIVKLREGPVGTGINLISDVPGLPSVERNLAYKAAKLLVDEFAIKQGIYMEVTKRIPIAAGLAGGSTDAASVLTGMNEMFNLGLKTEQLCELGARIGSDVPFCIRGGTMLATGRGEILQPLPAMPECYVVLAKPQVEVSTAWAYQQYDAMETVQHPNTEDVITCLQQSDLKGIANLLCNVLESVTIKEYKEIELIKQLMTHHGALASMMSGSGPTVFGLVDDADKAEYIAEKLEALENVQVILTKTVCGD